MCTYISIRVSTYQFVLQASLMLQTNRATLEYGLLFIIFIRIPKNTTLFHVVYFLTHYTRQQSQTDTRSFNIIVIQLISKLITRRNSTGSS